MQVFGVLQDWGVSKDNVTLCEPYPLRVLTSTSEHVDAASVDVAMTLCPHLLVGGAGQGCVDASLVIMWYYVM